MNQTQYLKKTLRGLVPPLNTLHHCRKKKAKSKAVEGSQKQEELELTAVKESEGAEKSQREETIIKEHRGATSNTQTLAEDENNKVRVLVCDSWLHMIKRGALILGFILHSRISDSLIHFIILF